AYTLAASATSLTGATSASFNVTPGAAASLVFSTQPSSATAGAAISHPEGVAAEDAEGNTATGFTGKITIVLWSNPGGSTLSGTTTAAAVSGVATFSTLSLDKTGSGYTLAASTTDLTGTTSASFDIVPGAAVSLVFSTQPSSATAGAAI